jgi:hypothetical protein
LVAAVVISTVMRVFAGIGLFVTRTAKFPVQLTTPARAPCGEDALKDVLVRLEDIIV